MLELFIAGFLGGLVAWYIRNWTFVRDFNQLAGQYHRIENSLRGQIGNERKAQQSEREAEAIGEFIATIMAKGDPADKMAQLQKLGMQYSDVAMKYAKKHL